jgi:hypothetical protein
MRRLTSAQYRNTLTDMLLLAFKGDSAKAKAVLAELGGALKDLPADKREIVPQDHHGSFRRLDQAIAQVHTDVAFDVAFLTGNALTQPSHAATVTGSCATDADASNDESCLQGFISKFGRWALRRPLSPSETEYYRSQYGASAKADLRNYASLMAAFLVAPQFVFQVELGGDPVDERENTYSIRGFELASRLSYALWDSMPDEALFAAAKSGELDTQAGLEAQVDRMLSDPRTRTTMNDFFEDWLKLEAVPKLESRNSEPLFRAFAGKNLPSPSLREHMIEEVTTLLDHTVMSGEGTVSDVFLDERVFVKHADLAAIYGVQPWDGQSEPALFPQGERPGLLTRAAFHAFGGSSTRPVMKGLFVRRAILCDELPGPPDDAVGFDPSPTAALSTRQAVEALTEDPKSSCVSCHRAMLNPIGYVTENIDALGRLRAEEVLFDEAGTEKNRVPVNTLAAPQVVLNDMTEVDSAGQLAELVVESGKPQACLARQYFRFTFGRWEDPKNDGCTLERLRRSISGDRPAIQIVREMMLTPAFRERVIPSTEATR